MMLHDISKRDTVPLILAALNHINARTILDIGSGSGSLAEALSKEGFSVTGIDPNHDAVGQARVDLPQARFEVAIAEMLPFPDGSFNAAIFLNSLHHVPEDRMIDALREGRRVLDRDGCMIVVEPQTSGSFFETMRPVEDETSIRKAAVDAVHRATDLGVFQLSETLAYDRRTTFADVDSFIASLTAIDPTRTAKALANRAEIEVLFARHALSEAGVFVLIQPLSMFLLTPA